MALAAAYARVMRALLPPGRLWRSDATAVLSETLLATAQEMARVDARAGDLINESDPRTTSELLPDFEQMLGLTASGTIDERRARVIALLLRRQRFRPVDFQQVLAPLLQQDPEDVVVLEQSRAFAISVGDDRQIFQFYIYRDPTLPGTADIAAAQALVDSMKPSHTRGNVIESLGFKCEDAHSLCDRDRLGV